MIKGASLLIEARFGYEVGKRVANYEFVGI